MEKQRAIGHTGSWFAKIAGKPYPCVHDFWRTGNEEPDCGDEYIDLGYIGTRHTNPNWTNFVESIRTGKRVILTSGRRTRRKAYIALWEVDGLETDDRGLRFRFVKQLAELD
jgi:hypothetical protein